MSMYVLYICWIFKFKQNGRSRIYKGVGGLGEMSDKHQFCLLSAVIVYISFPLATFHCSLHRHSQTWDAVCMGHGAPAQLCYYITKGKPFICTDTCDIYLEPFFLKKNLWFLLDCVEWKWSASEVLIIIITAHFKRHPPRRSAHPLHHSPCDLLGLSYYLSPALPPRYSVLKTSPGSPLRAFSEPGKIDASVNVFPSITSSGGNWSFTNRARVCNMDRRR